MFLSTKVFIKTNKYVNHVTIVFFSVMANPEAAPKIDWAYYKTRVAVPGLVDSFQKNYEALKIPYPSDTLTASIDAQDKQVKGEIEQFKSASQSRIVQHKKSIEHIQSLLPFDQMTMEDYHDAYPDVRMIILATIFSMINVLIFCFSWHLIQKNQHSGHIHPKSSWTINLLTSLLLLQPIKVIAIS